MLKLITEFGADNNKSLLLSMPRELLDNIEVNQEGEIKTISLIEVLKRYHQLKAQQAGLTLDAHIDLMDAIFNPDRAVDPKERRIKF